jgi:hypothetical protein
MYAFISYLCTMKTICKILIAVAMIATCDQIKAQKNMVLTERQQGLVTIAALEAKGDLTGAEQSRQRRFWTTA